MEQDQQQNLRQYAWNYLSFYGGQRARLLRLFVAVGSGLALGAAGLLRTEATEIVVAPLGSVLAILGILFWIMNRGLSAKVRHGEEGLRHLDGELKLPNLKGGAPHVLRLLEQGAGDGNGTSGCGGGCDESAMGSAVYILLPCSGFSSRWRRITRRRCRWDQSCWRRPRRWSKRRLRTGNASSPIPSRRRPD